MQISIFLLQAGTDSMRKVTNPEFLTFEKGVSNQTLVFLVCPLVMNAALVLRGERRL